MAKVVPIHTGGSLEPDSLIVSEQLDKATDALDGGIEFGDPQDPNDPTSAIRAGEGFETPTAGAHNGLAPNIDGSWVEVALTTTGLTKKKCYHNLYLGNDQATVPVTGEPNCRWLLFGIMHSGQGADAGGVESSRYGVDVAFVGDTVDVNYIELRFDLRLSGGAITVDGTYPVLVTLFFTKATRGE